MPRKTNWWKLYVFLACASAVLFFIPMANTAALILWVLAVYGVIALWMSNNPGNITQPYYPTVGRTVPLVAELFDEDRLQLQHNASQITDEDAPESYTERT